jgi:dTDP-4-amino-4,6-dideoxygalactose transaminase
MSNRIELIDVLAQRSRIGEEIDRRVAQVVSHGRFIMGPEVAEFEAATVDFIGEDGVHAVSCANGTDALVLALHAYGLQPGDGVICPAFTFVATAEAVAIVGGRPIFADVEDDGFNLSAESVLLAAKKAEQAGVEVKGICAVDLFGEPADYQALDAMAEVLGCWVLADGAQSFGGSSGGVRVGAVADVTTTSFFPAKPLGCYGDGGMVFTKDGDMAELMVSLRQHGKGSEKYDNVRIGQNSRLDTIQAAILLPKLAILGDEMERRAHVAARYHAGLTASGLVESRRVRVPELGPSVTSAWAQYTLVTEHRDRVRQALTEADIASAVYYPKPLHLQSGYRQYHEAGITLPRSTALMSQVVSLPMHAYLTDDQIDRVVAVVTEALS